MAETYIQDFELLFEISGPPDTPPFFTNTILSNGTVGKSYLFDIIANGTTPITLSIVGGDINLPAGLVSSQINSNTIRISGIPLEPINAKQFTIQASNSVSP